MPNAEAVFRYAGSFLKGSDTADSKIQELRQGIADILDSKNCFLEEGSYCTKPYLEGLLTQMKGVTGWTEDRHKSALKAGGYALDFVPWPKTPADP